MSEPLSYVLKTEEDGLSPVYVAIKEVLKLGRSHVIKARRKDRDTAREFALTKYIKDS